MFDFAVPIVVSVEPNSPLLRTSTAPPLRTALDQVEAMFAIDGRFRVVTCSGCRCRQIVAAGQPPLTPGNLCVACSRRN
jgi:hypothetical protein